MHPRGFLWAFAERAIASRILPHRHVARYGDAAGESKCARHRATDERFDHVDVRGSAADESPNVPSDDPLGASVVADHNDRDCGARSWKLAAGPHQHAGELRLAAWMPGNSRERRHGRSDSD